MFKIFSLERRVLEAVQNHLLSYKAETDRVISGMSKDIAAKAQQIDMLEAMIRSRIGKIEYLFADELESRDKDRAAGIRSKMSGK